ncbi:hypothetical protein niasHT_017851 [Heterodera trifolii]|uniref:Uncharacterized protein n=1 Tax=Heterodera trifolii TaxID=157864 RepID=A0ABD2LN01_9BILA
MLLIAFLITCCLLSLPPIFVVCFAPSRFVVQPSNGKTGGRNWRRFKASSPLMPRGKQQLLSISKQQATKTSSTTSPLLLKKSNRQQRIPLIRPQGQRQQQKVVSAFATAAATGSTTTTSSGLLLLLLLYTDNDQMEELRKKEEQLWEQMGDAKDEKQRDGLNTELQEVQGKLNTLYGQMKQKKTE